MKRWCIRSTVKQTENTLTCAKKPKKLKVNKKKNNIDFAFFCNCNTPDQQKCHLSKCILCTLCHLLLLQEEVATADLQLGRFLLAAERMKILFGNMFQKKKKNLIHRNGGKLTSVPIISSAWSVLNKNSYIL